MLDRALPVDKNGRIDKGNQDGEFREAEISKSTPGLAACPLDVVACYAASGRCGAVCCAGHYLRVSDEQRDGRAVAGCDDSS